MISLHRTQTFYAPNSKLYSAESPGLGFSVCNVVTLSAELRKPQKTKQTTFTQHSKSTHKRVGGHFFFGVDGLLGQLHPP